MILIRSLCVCNQHIDTVSNVSWHFIRKQRTFFLLFLIFCGPSYLFSLFGHYLALLLLKSAVIHLYKGAQSSRSHIMLSSLQLQCRIRNPALWLPIEQHGAVRLLGPR